MKVWVALLAIVMLTATGSSALADNHNIAPITVSTDAESYIDGDTVTITGTIKNVDADLLGAVVAQFVSPGGNRVGLAQSTPDTDTGDFTISLIAGGPLWSTSGEYTILITYNADKTDLTISYEAAAPEPEPEPAPVLPNCGEGTELVGDTCVIIQPEPEPEPEPEPIPPPPPAEEPEPEPEPVECGPGTQLVDGRCEVVPEPAGGGCLIATAAYGSELAPQVQYLREIRDNTLLSTSSGSSFMEAFNQMYYTVSPQIADLERENAAFRELVRVAITPMLTSLSIMSLAEEGSETSVLGLGLLVISLNAGMYVAAPALLGFKAYRLARRNRLSIE